MSSYFSCGGSTRDNELHEADGSVQMLKNARYLDFDVSCRLIEFKDMHAMKIKSKQNS